MTARKVWRDRRSADDMLATMDLDQAARAALVDHTNEMLTVGRSLATIELRLTVLRLLGRQIAPTRLLDATPLQLRQWQRALVPLSPETRRTYTCQVRGFYRWCLVEGLVDVDPAAGLLVPRVARGKPKPMPEDDLRVALQSATAEVRVWLVLAAGAGLRAMEIAGLERADVVDGAAVPHLVIHGKGERERQVPLAPWVLAELRAYGMPASGPLFLHGGAQVTPVMVGNTCNKHLYRQGIRFSLHKCRHRFATALYKATRDLRLVQEALGHESPATTIRYTDYDSSVTAAAVASLTVVGA